MSNDVPAFSTLSHESAAIHLMRRYGFAGGVEVPGVGRFRVHGMDDGTKILEQVL